ncbi:2OG-Fe(II) oxygenase family protein [Rhizoctonia solani 123E]|uniref:2OG-Fe(II) oxygenase family protein n=1 Tax=Rhizoctonia solani 123E TaxID=1423351 RepID=A0A074S222_9AGAM|nr:2OG-Fe(II) oxygenase family protein [Rhizoctonia solani 123E]
MLKRLAQRKLVEAWVDIAYTSAREDEPSPGTLLPIGEWENDPHYQGFFHTQRSLVERPDQALSLFNTYRKQLGLPLVDSDHPCLVSPELSGEQNDLLLLSKFRKRDATGKKTRRGKGAGKIRKSRLRGAFSRGSNRAAGSKVHKPVPTLEKLPESDGETDIWSDFPDEPPQSDHEDNPTQSQPSGEDKLDETNVHRLMPNASMNSKTEERFNLEQTSATRSSLRLAVSKSLEKQTAVLPPARSKSKVTLARKSKPKTSGKAQSQAKQSPIPKKMFPVASVEPDTLVASDSLPFKSDSAAGKLDSSDEESDGIPLKDRDRKVKTHAMDVDIEPSFINTSSFNMPPPEDTAQFLEPPMHASSVPSSSESSSIIWNDSYLTEYVRIPVWAKSRQELCELPYFKSMQGGVYTRGYTTYGYLLAGFPSPRDAWCHGGKLIISHGGGKNIMDEGESDPTKAKHQLGDDQLESDKSVRALLTSYRMFRPIVILAEADYEHLQKFNLKQGYAEGASYYVLGHYAIVAAWAEHEEVMTQGFIHTRWKFAFQYIEGNQDPPWWLQAPGLHTTAPEPPNREGVTQPSRERRKFGGIVSGNRKRVSEVTTESFTGAPSIDCNECRTLSPHVYALGAICLNPDCASFWKGYPNSSRKSHTQLSQNIPTGNIGETASQSLIATTGLELAVIGVAGSPAAVTEKADELFQQYQQDASNMNMFQRHAMKTVGSHIIIAFKGELYAQHYSHNAGAPYKYIAEAISTPFDCCPKSVVEAKDYIQYLCEPVLGKLVDFNEVLSVAYAEGQEMNFHSDDEPGLGPVIAGLTLGSHAEMLFRYHVARKKNLVYKNGPFRPSEARTSDDLDSNERVLQIILSHGDLLIMDGTEIQKQYEHAVFVRDTDMVRFAATARWIDPRPSAPTVVQNVHLGRDVHPAATYIPRTLARDLEYDLPPFTMPPTQTKVPQMDRRELYSPSQDLAYLTHDGNNPCHWN